MSVPTLNITAFDLAQRFVGVSEAEGANSNAHVLAMLQLDTKWVSDDAVPWCSAFVNYVAWLLRLPRSKSLAARSWLTVGRPITLAEAAPGFDVVILRRGDGPQPGPEVTSGAPGHVGFFAGVEPNAFVADASVLLLGGNQRDAVNVSPFPARQVLGVRRLL